MPGETGRLCRRTGAKIVAPQIRRGALRPSERADAQSIGKIDGFIQESRAFITCCAKQIGGEL